MTNIATALLWWIEDDAVREAALGLYEEYVAAKAAGVGGAFNIATLKLEPGTNGLWTMNPMNKEVFAVYTPVLNYLVGNVNNQIEPYNLLLLGAHTQGSTIKDLFPTKNVYGDKMDVKRLTALAKSHPDLYARFYNAMQVLTARNQRTQRVVEARVEEGKGESLLLDLNWNIREQPEEATKTGTRQPYDLKQVIREGPLYLDVDNDRYGLRSGTIEIKPSEQNQLTVGDVLSAVYKYYNETPLTTNEVEGLQPFIYQDKDTFGYFKEAVAKAARGEVVYRGDLMGDLASWEYIKLNAKNPRYGTLSLSS
ncbi:Hypothetical protein POVN_LOCUS452 [uncultured virus]|nr:Hypothetical protein POVN_LOCUS452 [uncultured virus]